MKQLMFMCVSGVIILLSLALIVTLWIRRIRVNDLDKALVTSIEQTMQSIEKGTLPAPVTSDQMQDTFTRLLCRKIDAGKGKSKDKGLELDVSFISADPIKGILSVCVDETFTYPTGLKGHASAKRTAIREKEINSSLAY